MDAGYDTWKCTEPPNELALQEERAAYEAEAREDARPLHYRLEWFFDWILQRIVVRFERESARHGWWKLNEAVGETLEDAIANLRAQRRARR